MAERPILFSGAMVRALLAGTKTQTRRAIKPQPYVDTQGNACWNGSNFGQDALGPLFSALASPLPSSKTGRVRCPYGAPGDRLWVRESLNYDAEYGHYFAAGDGHGHRTYLCSLFDDEEAQTGYSYECTMREGSVPSIHLPRRYSRITLEVTGVRVERLQDISRGDAMAEGCPFANMAQGDDPRQWYAQLWDSINGAGSCDANPWVWVVEFKRCAS